MKNNKKMGLLLNIMIPIFLGAVIYYLYSPDVLFVRRFDSVIGLEYHEKIWVMDNLIFKFIRNYFLDMLWAYALVIALFFVIGNNAASVLKILFIGFSFTIILEILQITPVAEGTFDFCDIVVEFLAEVVAVLIIKKYFLEERRK
jgi:hypothetical protein